MNIKWKLLRMLMIAIAPSVVFGAGLWLANDVYAASTTFPGQNAVGDVAVFGANSVLDAPESDFTISANGSASPNGAFSGTITVNVWCWDSTAGQPGLSMQLTTEAGTAIGGSKSTTCPGSSAPSQPTLSINVPMSSTYDDSANYQNQLETIWLHINKTGTDGHQPFWVTVDDPSNKGNVQISYKADPAPGNKKFSYNSSGFAIWMGGNGAAPNSGSYDFKFTPTCNWTSGDTIYLKWSGANVGVTNSYGQLIQPNNPDYPPPNAPPPPPGTNNIETELDEFDYDGTQVDVHGNPSSQPIWQAGSLTLGSGTSVVGNPGVFDSSQPNFQVTSDFGGTTSVNNPNNAQGIPISKHHYYEWKWTNVNPSNPIYLEVPFSSNLANSGSTDPCGAVSQPEGSISGTCYNYQLSGYDTGVPNANVSFEVLYDSSTGGVDFSGTTNQGGTTSDSSGNHDFTNGRTYVLMIQGPDDSGWNDVSSFKPGCGGGGGVSTDYCTYVKVAVDSNHRAFVAISGNNGGIGGIGVQDNVPTSNSSQDPYPVSSTSGSLPMYSPVTNGFPDPSPFVGYVIPHGPTSGGTYTTTLSFQANPSVTIRVDEQSDSGTWGNDVVEVPYTTTPCYDATCTITSVVGDGPGGIVQASHQFTVNATINNIGYETLPTTLSNDPLSLNGGDENGNGSYWNFEHDVGYPISAGSASPNIAITLTAPTTLTAETLILHPAYSGLFSFGSGSDCQPPWPSPGCISTPQCPCGEASTDCHSPIIPYSSFQLTPSATASPGPLATDENPTSVNYNAWVSNNAGQNLGSDSLLSSISQFYVLPAGGTQSNPSSSSPNPNTINSYQNGTNYTLSPYNATGGTYSPNIATVRAGDQYCSYIYFPNNLNAGYVGPGGVVAMEYNVAANDSALSCVNVNNKPYTQFFGSDVSAAGGFGTTNCNDTTNGNIYTYLDTSSTPGTGKGSSTQFGAEALNIIEGLGSASLNGTPSVYDGLTFANTGPGTPHNSGNSPQGDYGGNYALQNNCVTDYYNSTLPTKLTTGNSFSSMKPGPALNNGENALDAIRTSTTANSNTINDITLYYQPPAGGSLTINGNSNFPADTNETIYVNGNVYISGDICYSACAANPSWTNVADIPSLFIIAKGNILIAPGVSQLDGAYIAEPTDSAGKVNGIINTCAQNTTSAYPISGIFTNCNNQLTVNGAFVARQIFLDRSYSSLRFGQSGENPLSTTTRSCGAPGSDIPLGAPNEPDCAAEIFNFSPELYLSQPASLSSSGPGSETFDYYTSLPPVL